MLPVQQTTITDPRGYQEQLTFDSVGFVTHILTALGYPEGQSTTIDREETYNTHLINSITDPLGRQTCYTYDGLANVTAVTRLCNSTPVTTKYTYESHSQMSSVQDPLGHKWTINYDSLGSPTSIVDPLNHTTTLNFSSGPTSFGVLNWVADALNNKTQFFYNSYGDLDEIIDPRGSATYRNTDTVGRVTSIEDPLRNTTSFQYDNLDHLKLITDPKGGKTQFGYDQNENLTSVIDAQWTTYKTQYGYDAMNRRISRTDALNKAESYQYDESSNLTKYTDRNGNYVNYSYDGINRRISASFCCAGQDYITYTWDGGDRLTKASDALAGSITRHPDLLDRLTSEVSPQGTVSYTYDNADRRQTMTVAGQNAVNYTYDIANRLTQISQSGVGTVGFQYDNADRRTLLTLPNGVTQTYVYDNGGQGDSHLTSLTYKHGNTTIGTLSYGYDADGRRGSVGGSLAAVSIPQAVTPNTFNADNAMTLFDSTGFSRAVLSYDSDGQMTSDQIDTYTWDVRRHLSAISGFDTASFVYDALGRRVSKTVNGTTTKFLYDGLNPVQELNGSNGVIANMLTGLNIDEYFARTEPGCCGPLSYLTDALGSTLALTDSSGTVQNQYQYEPFGNAWSPVSNNTSTNSYQFTGRENDGESGYDLDYYRGRYYSPVFQRFISQDPIEFMGGNPNLYAYANNSPSNFGDQYGLETGFVSLESSQNPPPFPPPDVTIGVDSPIGGVQTTLPFASGGKPTTVTRPLSWTQPLLWPPDAVAKVFIETSPGKSARLQCQVRSPFVGLSTGIDTNGNPNVGGLGPQINFPIPETGVNFYVGTKWGTPGAITK